MSEWTPHGLVSLLRYGLHQRRAQYRRDFLSKQFARCETLCSEFINEAARLHVESLDRQIEKASGLVTIHALQNRIRLNAPGSAHDRQYA
jgi:hypothetical protein